MNSFTEPNYQSFIINFLVSQQGWVKRTAKDYDPSVAMDRELLISFLQTTQPDEYAAVAKVYKSKADKVIVDSLNKQLLVDGIVSVLKKGFPVDDVRFFVRAPKPDAPYNKKAWNAYRANVFSVAKEVWASDKERVDIVLFLNGIALAAIELKDNNAGQSIKMAIEQWQNDRSPKTRLFLEKGGVLVMFAVDLKEVRLTTRLNGTATKFLPFNKGCNAGHDDIDCGAGNPPAPDGKHAVHYLWEDLLARDRVLEIITRYVYVGKDEYTDLAGKTHYTEKVIFPRYHQIDCVTQLVNQVMEHGTKRNYLIQHSTGSGKTNTICWLAYRLASLFRGGEKPGEPKEFVFDHVIVMTDRRVVIGQLQAAVKQLENSPGYVKSITDDDPSSDLSDAFKNGKRIIATTIQRFAYIQKLVADMSGKRFAVLIDEAHSSTKGKSLIMVKRALGAEYDPNDTPDVQMQKLLARQCKQPNVSMFAFTATPRPETIQLFGQHAGNSKREAFHTYSMKQAIEEGFILDVLKNYTEYETYYKIVKKIESDPLYKTKKAKAQIHDFAMCDPQTVKERTTVIVGHFLKNATNMLGSHAKAMVVTESRKQAVAYWTEINAQLRAMGRDDVKAIVAFSGSLTVKGKKVREHDLNGFSEDVLPKRFCMEQNRILVVADKYQTGFDQPFLAFMYVLKKLRDIPAVQTISRLNRTCMDYEKQTFVLDFANRFDDIVRSFSLYFRSTWLNNAASCEQLEEASTRLDQFAIFDDDDCNDYWIAVCNEDEPGASKILSRVERRFGKLTEADQDECHMWLMKFDQLYPFVAQAVNLTDSDLFRRDQMIHPLLRRIKNEPDMPLDLRDKIAVVDVKVKEGKTTSATPEHGKGTNLPTLKPKPKEDDLETKLSVIIEELNSRYPGEMPEIPDSQKRNNLMTLDDAMKSDRQLAAIGAEPSNTYEDYKKEARKRFEKIVSRALTDNTDMFKFLLAHTDALNKLSDVLAENSFACHRCRADHCSFGD